MILAAGRGERLRPLTETVPKPLVEVNGETLIERHLHALASAGITEVVVNLCHLGELIEARLGSGQAFGVDIAYVREPDEPLETAGGIIGALPLLEDTAFAVINGDIWTDYPFADLPRDTRSAHLVLVPNPSHHREGDFALAGGRASRLVPRPLTYAGIGVFAPGFFAELEPGRRPLGPLLFAAAQRGDLGAERYDGRWFDIGTPERLAEVRRVTRDRHVRS